MTGTMRFWLWSLLLSIAWGLSVTAVMDTSAQELPPAVSVRVYTVAKDPEQFGVLPAGRTLVFRNGLFQSPDVDYSQIGGKLQFRPGVLNELDVVSVVTLP